MTDPITQAQGRTLLPELAVLQIQGADASTFLQGQLTNDIVQLAQDKACLAGYCTAKGRLLATLVTWRETGPDGTVFRALVRSDIAQSLAKRLTMFVLRAKVAIQVTAQQVVGEVSVAAPDTAPAPTEWSVHTDKVSGATRIQAPGTDTTGQRAWLVLPLVIDGASQDSAPIVQEALDADAHAAWQAGDIRAGFGWICAANQDLYIPQTLNMDLIGGISFRKGCYPGQEVVARSHYRGTIKRRMAYGTVEAQAEVGMDLFDAQHPANPCGRVINQARTGLTTHLLLEVQLADIETADFRLGTAQGATVTLQPLPYSLTPAA